MKHLISLVFLISLSLSSFEQIVVTTTDSAWNNNGDNLHKAANNFAYVVGNVLKDEYPSRIDELDVTLTTNYLNQIVISYTASIVECDSNMAQYYFDHRGSLEENENLDLARYWSKQRCQNQIRPVQEAFQKTYGSCHQIYIFTHTKQVSTYWALTELFITAKK